MAKLRIYRVPTQIAWAASGSISQELSPVPFTITGLFLDVHASITTTTATNFNDYWDRLISQLNLTGQVNGQQKTFFDFKNMRLPYHFSRFQLGRFAPLRPTVTADSQTTALKQFGYYIHLGAKPFKNNGELDHMDLTAGIPPTQKGQLTLGGSFAANSAMGTNVTIADGDIDVYLIGVQDEPGDPPQLWMPQAFPVWSMESPSLSATSTIFGTSHNITAGNFLRAIALMTTNGSNSPRDDQVLNSIRLYHQLENRDIVSFGGRAGASDAAGGDYKAAELITQLGLAGAAPSEGSSVGVPGYTEPADKGLLLFRLADYTTKVHPLYGADLRKVATGDIRLDYGISDATGVTMDLLYQRYELNPEHPANAGWL